MQKSNMPLPARRTLYSLFLIALMAALAACSSLRLAYNNGDTLLYWWLDGYVDLNSDQKGWVKNDIDKLFQWHRKTQLEDYIQILQTGQRQLAGNPTAADLTGEVDATDTAHFRLWHSFLILNHWPPPGRYLQRCGSHRVWPGGGHWPPCC